MKKNTNTLKVNPRSSDKILATIPNKVKIAISHIILINYLQIFLGTINVRENKRNRF